jgi:hypothetical protein
VIRDLGVGLEAQTGGQARDQGRQVGGRLRQGLQKLRRQRVEEMGIPGSLIEDDELVIPGLPVEVGAFGQLPADGNGGRVRGGQ